MRKFLAFLLAGLMILSLCSCSAISTAKQIADQVVQEAEKTTETKVITVEELSITLPADFETLDDTLGYDLCVNNNDALVMGFREAYAAGDDLAAYSAEEYAELLMSVYFTEIDVTTGTFNGCPSYEYVNVVEGDVPVRYLGIVMKSGSAFWQIQFCTPEETFDSFRDTIAEWAASITFAD